MRLASASLFFAWCTVCSRVLSMEAKPKIIVIVGPTASGKTTLGISLAKQMGGEIISADSRQVYRGLDLGTGKVTPEEMNDVPHHLLDIADPNEIYTVADFVRDGRAAITNCINRMHVPIIVGGTFFYVDALIGKISTPEVPPNLELRAKLESITTDALYNALTEVDERRSLDIDPKNKRRIIRALEIVHALGVVPEQKTELLYDALTIGIDIPKDTLVSNIKTRLAERIDAGMIEEVETLYKNGLSYERMEELGLEYRYISRYLRGELSKEMMLEELETKIRQYAKRQMTWLKRDKSIHWFKKDDPRVTETISIFLSKEKGLS